MYEDDNDDFYASDEEAYNDMSWERGPNESDEDYADRLEGLESLMD